MSAAAASQPVDEPPSEIELIPLLRLHWKKLLLAGFAVLGISAADLLQPWPLKIVLDYVIASGHPPRWLNVLTSAADKSAILTVAIVAVAAITIVDSISSYAQTYLMT